MEYSKMRRDWSARYSIESTSVATEPISARIFRNWAKSSTMKLPPKVLPTGTHSSSTPVRTSRQTASPVTRLVVCGPR